MIYFTSDTHFYHSNIINLSSRPFKDVTEMHRTLITNWNALVNHDDEIYILGDFSYKGSAAETNRILNQLNGKKYLIIGNHDTYIEDPEFDSSAFEWIKHYHVLNYKKRKFVLFHYPILEWQGFFGDAIHLYGHVHNSSKDPKQKKRLDILGPNAFNVGVDVNHYFPINIEEYIKKAQP